MDGEVERLTGCRDGGWINSPANPSLSTKIERFGINSDKFEGVIDVLLDKAAWAMVAFGSLMMVQVTTVLSGH